MSIGLSEIIKHILEPNCMHSKEMHTEVESIVKCLEMATYAYNKDLRDDGEIRAAISHWLFDEKAQFISRSEDLVRLWDTKKSQYLHDLRARSKKLAANLESIFNTRSSASFTFIDLFAGIGGFRLAMEKHGGHCVFSSEWDRGAKETYFDNNLEVPFGDINQFTDLEITTDAQLANLVPDHDVLAAGFPCQPFSHAGVSARKSLGQTHGFECDYLHLP